MKKFLAMLLASTMVLSLSVTAFAANEATADADSENKATIDVTGKYEKDYINADTVISVDVAWDSMEFTYAAGGYEGEWNPGDHSYKNDNSGDWVKKTSDITVTNHSNSAVEASFSFEKIANGITGTFDKESVILATAVGTTKDNAPKDTVEFTIGGTMAASDTKLGTITVAIAESDGIEWTNVTTWEAFKAAVANGGNIKLSNDITMNYDVDITNTVTLDLNNYTLNTSGRGLWVKESSDLTIKNGTVLGGSDAIITNEGGNMNMENCTLTSYKNPYLQISGTATLKNCTLNGRVAIEFNGTGTITLLNRIDFNAGTASYAGDPGIDVGYGDGKVICDFDPTDYVKDGQYRTITDNGDGTWTVTYK